MKFEENLFLSIDNVIFGYDEYHEQLKVLLIEQERINDQYDPFKALPGDLILKNEDLPEAANRVLKELTGLEGIFLKQFQAFGDPLRIKQPKDQQWLKANREYPDSRVITIGYYALVRLEDFSPTPSSFAQKAEWVTIDEIPDLAFDHNEILEGAIRQLRNDTLNYNISFELLPKKFTLAQLQSLYEIILGKELDKRNFRKSVKKMEAIIPLNEKQKGVYHKPAQLYTVEKQLDQSFLN